LQKSIAEPPKISGVSLVKGGSPEEIIDRNYNRIQKLAAEAFKKAMEELSFEGIIGGMDEPTLQEQSQEPQKNKP